MILNHRRNQAQTRIGGVDTHRIDPIEKKLQRLAERARLLLLRDGNHSGLDIAPLLLGLLIALRRLHALDDSDDPLDERSAAAPLVQAPLRLRLDIIKVDQLRDVVRLPAAGEVVDPVPDLGQDAKCADVARRGEEEIVDERVPERLLETEYQCLLRMTERIKITHLMERLADPMEDRILDAAAARFVELERRIQKQFVR